MCKCHFKQVSGHVRPSNNHIELLDRLQSCCEWFEISVRIYVYLQEWRFCFCPIGASFCRWIALVVDDAAWFCVWLPLRSVRTPKTECRWIDSWHPFSSRSEHTKSFRNVYTINSNCYVYKIPKQWNACHVEQAFSIRDIIVVTWLFRNLVYNKTNIDIRLPRSTFPIFTCIMFVLAEGLYTANLLNMMRNAEGNMLIGYLYAWQYHGKMIS